MRKKRIGLSSNSPLARTGFGRNSRALTEWLIKNRPDLELFFLHQGMHDKDPNLKRFPYTSWGALTDEIVNTEQFQKDGNYQRLCSYGNLRIEEFCKRNELDFLLVFEDQWGLDAEYYYKKKWFEHIRPNFYSWITLDSVPILDTAKEWIKNSDNYLVWSSFAQKELIKESPELYGKVKYLPGCLNTSQFKPLPESERQELRKKFNIQPDETIILHLGRSQLRKLFLSNLDALASFKKIYPEKKVKLHFHCSWSEGWNLPKAIKERGLNPEDVLATYCCLKCGHWNIQPFTSEPIKCPSCQEEKSFVTAGVNSSITEEELNKVYSVSDASSSPFTSGALEYFNVESLLVGNPLISSPYAAGLDFVEQPFVDSMEGTYNVEIGTQFLKFQPNPNSIVKFFNKIHDMSPGKRKEIGQKGREFALSRFDVEKVGRQLCEFIDKSDYLDWSKFDNKVAEYETKIPDAEIPKNIESDKDYVKTLYKDIMKMDVEDTDSGLIGWLSNFNNITDEGQKLKIRQQIENSFRKIAADHNAKNNPVDFKSFIDLDRPNKRGLIVVRESAGDCFIVSSLFKSFHEKYKDYDLYISTQDKYKEVFEGNSYVHKVIPYHPIVESEMAMIGAGLNKEDAYFHFYGMPTVCTQKVLNYLSHDKSGNIV